MKYIDKYHKNLLMYLNYPMICTIFPKKYRLGLLQYFCLYFMK